MLFLYACVCVVQIIIGRKKHTSTLYIYIYIHAHKMICLNLLLLKARQITKRARSISTVYFFFYFNVCVWVCLCARSFPSRWWRANRRVGKSGVDWMLVVELESAAAAARDARIGDDDDAFSRACTQSSLFRKERCSCCMLPRVVRRRTLACCYDLLDI